MSCETCSRATRGWLGGCLTATAVIQLCFLFILALLGANRGTPTSAWDFAFLSLIGLPPILLFVCVLSGIPSMATIWLSERLGIRSLVFFVLAGGLIGSASQLVLFRSVDELGWLYFAAGCFAGLNYWYVAGRYAGAETEQPER
jgi:hypothetical protein